MRLIDTYFKAFIDYKKHTTNNNDATRAKRVVKQANRKDETLTITKFTSNIEEEWVKAIEEGLVHVEKAIFEERQFIRTDGEVVNIEKVKKTSKDSVEHLSKNSNFITRLPEEGEILIPDKLYITEKLSDYAVYENRFLYMLLSHLKDFLETRISKIKAKVTAYHAEMNLIKKIKFNNRTVDYNLDFSDEYLNDPYLLDAYYKIPLIDRIEEVYFITEALLRTELMREVSKVAMLKPPITKTNVLRMNPNFRGATTLYEFISSYTKDGYTFEELKKTYNPLGGTLSDEVAEVIELSTFVIYQHGNEITNDLKKVYDDNLIKEQLLKEERDRQELIRLKKRVHDMKLDYEQYILLLEKTNNSLEKKLTELDVLKTLNRELTEQLDTVTKERDLLLISEEKLKEEVFNLKLEIQNLIKAHEEEIISLNKAHELMVLELKETHQKEKDNLINHYETLITSLEEEHLEEIKTLEEAHLKTINTLESSHLEEVNEIKSLHEENISKLNNAHVEKINTLNENFDNERTVYQEEIDKSLLKVTETLELNKELTIMHEEVIKEYEVKFNDLENERDYTLGQFYSLQQRKGITDNNVDHTSKEKFKELSQVKKAFDQYFNEQWRLTKLAIKENLKKEMMEKRKE